MRLLRGSVGSILIAGTLACSGDDGDPSGPGRAAGPEIAVSAFAAATGGSYSLRVDPRTTDVTCVITLMVSPIATSQSLGASDCNENGFLGDYYFFGLPLGATVTASVTGAAFQPFVAVWQPDSGTRVASGAASVSYTNTLGSALFYVYVGTQTAGMSGAYNLNFAITYPAAPVGGAADEVVLFRTSPEAALSAALRAQRTELQGRSPSSGTR